VVDHLQSPTTYKICFKEAKDKKLVKEARDLKVIEEIEGIIET